LSRAFQNDVRDTQGHNCSYGAPQIDIALINLPLPRVISSSSLGQICTLDRRAVYHAASGSAACLRYQCWQEASVSAQRPAPRLSLSGRHSDGRTAYHYRYRDKAPSVSTLASCIQKAVDADGIRPRTTQTSHWSQRKEQEPAAHFKRLNMPVSTRTIFGAA
jgi:hypothetical protein